ncbi:MAG: tetratricopeptide repeat protein [Actinomycetota bacterium]
MEEVRAAAGGVRASDALDLLERAVVALERGRTAQAERDAGTAKRKAPRSAAVREILGLAHYQAGHFREALRELQAYRRMSGRADQNHLMADAHRALGSPQRALPLIKEALRARIPAEAKAEAAVVGGSALADMGRYDEALAMLRRAAPDTDVAEPHHLRVWYVIADILERAGRPAEATRVFRRIIRHDPDAFDVPERLAALGDR